MTDDDLDRLAVLAVRLTVELRLERAPRRLLDAPLDILNGITFVRAINRDNNKDT